MVTAEQLLEQLKKDYLALLDDCIVAFGELTIEVSAAHLREMCVILRDR